MGGGAIISMTYCFVRLQPGFKKRPLARALISRSPPPILLKNGAMAASGGIMLVSAFFFYAWGEANIPARLGYVNWMLHMSGYVLCGGLVGLALGEWKGVQRRPVRLLWVGILVIIAAANLVGLERGIVVGDRRRNRALTLTPEDRYPAGG